MITGEIKMRTAFSVTLFLLLLLPISATRAEGVNAQAPNAVQSGLPFHAGRTSSQWSEEEFYQAVRQMEAQLSVGTDHQIVINMTVFQATDAGLDAALFEHLLGALIETNKLLARGDITISDVSLSSGLNLFGETVDPIDFSLSTESSLLCAGQTNGYQRWYGYALYLDHCLTGQVIGLLNQLSGAAAVCALLSYRIKTIPVSIICAASAGLTQLGAGYIENINASGGYQGIIVDTDWWGHIIWVWHQ
jgi:hypothetical protein